MYRIGNPPFATWMHQKHCPRMFIVSDDPGHCPKPPDHKAEELKKHNPCCEQCRTKIEQLESKLFELENRIGNMDIKLGFLDMLQTFKK